MLRAGDRIDRYVVLGLLGTGGMGEVYRARDPRLDREVALKILRVDKPTHDGGSSGGARLLREARAAAALEHPNVIAVFDVGEIAEPAELSGTPYLAMELLRGRNLRSYVGDPSVPLATRARWLIDVARALAAAHGRHIVHRDVKPENVMIRDDGVVKVLDFGIAKRLCASVDTISSSTDGQIIPTLAGAVVGTPAYMSPEQMRGEVLDGRTDQFSWGVVAYELLCGEPPWRTDGDALHLVSQVLSQEPAALCERNPEVPRAASEVVKRALAKERAQRFDSTAELVEAFTAAMGFTGPTVPVGAPLRSSAPAPSAGTGRRLAALIAALASCAAAFALYRLRAPVVTHEGAPTVAAPAPGHCTANRDCARGAGAPSICRKDDGVCVALASEDCRVYAEPAHVSNDATVWFGAMFPMTGEDAAEFGTSNMQAFDLGRRDFAQILSGYFGGDAASIPPLAFVGCDDAKDPARAARHLAEDLRVPAVVGFRSSAEVIELATSVFLERRVMTVAALNTSPLISRIPHPAGAPRLVWRTTYSTAESALAVAAVVRDLFEPELRKDARVLGPARPMKVALLRAASPAGLGFSSALFANLRFNGKSALDNGANYREISLDEDAADVDVLHRKAADELGAFAPHVVVYNGHTALIRSVVRPAEERWAGAYRPRIISGTGFMADVFPVVGNDAGLRKRLFATTAVSTTVSNARFVVRYNEVYRDSITRTVAPNSSYDAFYLLAYATYALGGQRPTGPALAGAIARLVPAARGHSSPVRPRIEVGPENIFDGFDVLRNGGSIDLQGATSAMDFDLTTGESPVDHAILCVTADASGKARDSVESGLVYDAARRSLEGELRCP